jgi:hypothetical protein
MRKALQDQARLLLIGMAAIVIMVTIVDAKPAADPNQDEETVECTSNMGTPNGSNQLWESLSQQFVSTVSCY